MDPDKAKSLVKRRREWFYWVLTVGGALLPPPLLVMSGGAIMDTPSLTEAALSWWIIWGIVVWKFHQRGWITIMTPGERAAVTRSLNKPGGRHRLWIVVCGVPAMAPVTSLFVEQPQTAVIWYRWIACSFGAS
ncbi:MAG: hypothetical protein ACT4QD_03445 [Acidobacteriota bacterium]